jgi:DNA-binding IclR family transcriptional regulator
VIRITDHEIHNTGYSTGIVEDAPSTGNVGGIQVIRRAAAVLRSVSDHQGQLRLADLAPELGLAKTTIHRVVNALVDEHMLRVDQRGFIWLGPSLVSLGRVAATDLTGMMRPVLEALAEQTGETVDLAVLDGRSVRFIDQIPSHHRLRAVSTVGAAFPLHCSANGKALLAALPSDRVDELLPRRLEQLTPNTLITRAALDAELEAIRQSGVAEDREEHSLGIRAVGIALCDDGGPAAAISIPVPADRFEAVESLLCDALLATAVDFAASRRS